MWHCCEDDTQVAKLVFDHSSAVSNEQQAIHTQSALFMKIYAGGRENQYWDSWLVREVAYEEALASVANIKHSENIISTVVNTLWNNLSSFIPKVSVLSNDSNFDSYIQARKLDLFLFATMFPQCAEAATYALRDCIITHLGAYRIWADDEVTIKRVHPDEILIPQTCPLLKNDYPSVVYHRRLISRETAVEWAKALGDDKKVEAIAQCQMKSDWVYSDEITPKNKKDFLVCIEAFYCNDDASKNKYALCFENICLEYRTWELDCPPFVFFRWEKPLKGYYGYPLVESIIPYQLRLNELNAVIKRGQQIMCVPRIFVPQGGEDAVKPIRTKLNNEIGEIYSVNSAEKPVVDVWPGASPEIYQERERQRPLAFAQIGLSELAATSSLPEGARLDSSKALREMSLISDRRYYKPAKMFEQGFIQTAHIIIQFLKHNKQIIASYRDNRQIRNIDFKKISRMKNDFRLALAPSSMLNTTTAARVEDSQMLINLGILNKQDTLYLIKSPDTSAILGRATAFVDTIITQMSDLLDGEPVQPSVYQDHELAIEYAKATLNSLLVLDDTPDEIIENIQNYVSQCTFWIQENLKQAALAQQEQQMMMPQPAQQGV